MRYLIYLYLISSMIRAVQCAMSTLLAAMYEAAAWSPECSLEEGIGRSLLHPTALQKIVRCNLAQGPIQTRCASRPKWRPIINGERLQRWAAMLELKISVM